MHKETMVPLHFGPNTPEEQNQFAPSLVDDDFEFPDITQIMKAANEAIDKAKSTNYKIRHIDNAIKKLDRIRSQGLDKLRKLEDAGLESADCTPVFDAIHDIDNDIRDLQARADNLKLFEEEKKDSRPIPVLRAETVRAMELAAKTFLTPDEAAEYTTLGKDYVYNLLTRGGMPGSKIGTRWVIPRKELEDWVSNHSRHKKAR
jgi:excisionase family DNA binding protein